MKKSIVTLLLSALLLALFTGAALAEEEPIKINFVIYNGSNDTVQPDYPDLSSMIGEGLTQDDFTILYHAAGGNASMIDVDRTTGAVTVNRDLDYIVTMQVKITYIPKVEGVGKQTAFLCDVRAGRRLTGITLSRKELNLALDQETTVSGTVNTFYIAGGLKVSGYDEALIEVKTRTSSYNDRVTYVDVKPLKPGKTQLIFTGYNGLSETMPVTIGETPTGVSFAADSFTCYEGETVDIGFQLAPEGSHADLKWGIQEAYTVYNYDTDFFPNNDRNLFYARGAYDYKITVTTHNGLTATTYVHSYDKETAVRLAASKDVIRMGDEDTYIYAYDAKDRSLRMRYMEVTRGADIASLDGNRIITTGLGEFEVTVTNYDGSTVSQTFKVIEMPTKIILNTTGLTMNIGDTFDVEVGFDQGELEYTVGVWDYSGSYYGLYPVRQEGQRIIAQHPGTATLVVRAGELEERVPITVLDSDLTLTLEVPPQPFGVGQRFQMSVHDKTGKVYPATFKGSQYDTCGSVTADGLVTATSVGYLSVFITLEDGRYMSTNIAIVKVPAWLQHDALIIHMGDTAEVKPKSDVGDISWRDVTVEIADEKILKYHEFAGDLEPKKVGSTKVTIKSIYSDAQTTFTVEVVKENSELYIATGSIRVPYGYSTELPVVTNSKGDEVVIRWKITYNNPGEGNPNSSGFTLEDDVITCTWPTASCELTGTKWDGSAKVKLTVHGYKLPDDMYTVPEVVELAPGESQKVTVDWDEPGAMVEQIVWLSENEDVATVTTYSDGSAMIYGKNPGTTYVIAAASTEHYALCLVTVRDPRTPGDANDDGSVDIADALLVLQYDAGWGVSLNHSNADVNADGVADIADALLLLQYDAGWDVTLK